MNKLEIITWYLGGGLIIWLLNRGRYMPQWFWALDLVWDRWRIIWLGIFNISWNRREYSDEVLDFSIGWNID